MDAYRWLRKAGFRGRIVFLTGHAATHPEAKKAQQLGDARLAEKPLSIPQLDALLSGSSSS
jgi:hypothetical protein